MKDGGIKIKTIYEACKPREEVLGKLTVGAFAADISQVAEGTAHEIYQDPAKFFDNTYPTKGLKTLIRKVFGRLSGAAPDTNPIIKLETAFGGGKTHDLIALFHIAREGAAVKAVGSYIDEHYLPREKPRIVAVNCENLDTQGWDHGDATTHTLWGEIAYQLGGAEGYERWKEFDREMQPPGKQSIEKLVGEGPALIIIDELPLHLRDTKSVRVKNTTLDEFVVPFFQKLLSFASTRENVVVIYGLTERRDAYGEEVERLSSLREIKSISARKEEVVTPIEDAEIPLVVNKRLFESIDADAPEEVAEGYMKYLREEREKGASLPAEITGAEFKKDLCDAYPFHKETLGLLSKKIAGIPNFQKARGALRILAYSIKNLWEKREEGGGDVYLIHPYHIPLHHTDVREEVISRLDRQDFFQPLWRDVYSDRGDSFAQLQDGELLEIGKPPLGSRIAYTVFLHSLPYPPSSGVRQARLNLALGAPDVELATIEDTLTKLRDRWWYIDDTQSSNHRFITEPSVNKIVDEEVENVSMSVAKSQLDKWVRTIYSGRIFEPVFFPDEPGDVPDDPKDVKMVIFHYDSELSSGSASPPGPKVRAVYERSGSARGYRVFQNGLFFLVADKEEITQAIRAARRYKALKRITTGEYLEELQKKQRDKLRSKKSEASLDLRVAITNTYRHLFYPIEEGAVLEESPSGVMHHVLPVQESTEAKRNQQKVVLEVLEETLQKALAGKSKPPAPAYLKKKIKTWSGMSTEDLRKEFFKKRSLPFLIDDDLLRKTITRGTEKKEWVYYDKKKGEAYHGEATRVEIKDEAAVYSWDEAESRGLIEEEEEEEEPKACPACGSYPCECPVPPVPLPEITGEGEPKRAFQELYDRCSENEAALSRVSLKTTGTDHLKMLGLTIPQMPKEVELVLHIDYLGENGKNSLEVKFQGDWPSYRKVKSVVEGFSDKADVEVKIDMSFPDSQETGSRLLEEIKRNLAGIGLGKIELEGHKND